MSKYLILIYDEEAAWMNASEDVANELMAKHNAFGEKNGEAVLGGNALQSVSTATTLRPDGSGGLTVTDGPFLETKEYLASWYLLDVDSEARALEIAAELPSAKYRPVEVWPILHEASRETGDDMGVA